MSPAPTGAAKRIALNGRPASRRLLRACCRFGIGVTRERAPAPASGELDALLALPPGALALLTGASGSGKSQLLQRLLQRLRDAAPEATLCDLSSIYRGGGSRSVIDLIPLPLERALRLLALAGLADPFVLGRTAREISVGERARFALARALAKQRSGWMLIDEFLTTLDRETAAAVARSFRRAAREFAPEVRVVVATAHEDLAEHVAPDVHVRM